MKAVAHTSKDIASLADIELPKPSPSGRDLLVRVEAVSVNPVDTKRRMVETKEPKVLGWDAAGVVEAAGSEATLFKPGDAVYYAGDVTRPGSNSEFHLVDERIVGRAEVARLLRRGDPFTAITAWESYFDRLKVQSGRTLLILGGAGGVGSIGIQIAKLAGLKVIATASRPETIAWVKEMGADEVVDHRKDLPSQVKRSVDYIAVYNNLDMHWAAIGELIAPQGGIVSIVGNLKPLAMDAVRAKSASLCWELMFTRPRFKTPDMIEQHKLLNQVADWLDSGKLRGTLKQTLAPINAANLRKAHAQLESGTTIGKLALTGWR
jgi:zinc-binding alcohol dehydrogenase family protein